MSVDFFDAHLQLEIQNRFEFTLFEIESLELLEIMEKYAISQARVLFYVAEVPFTRSVFARTAFMVILAVNFFKNLATIVNRPPVEYFVEVAKLVFHIGF